MSDEKFWNNLLELLIEAKTEVSTVIDHLAYLNTKLGIIDTMVLIKSSNDANKENDTKE